MNKDNRNIVLTLLALLASGFIGARYDDPIELLGILAMYASGILSVYLTIKNSRTGVSTPTVIFTLMISLSCITAISRIMQWPFLPFILIIVCTIGFAGLIIHRIVQTKRAGSVSKEDTFIFIASTLFLFFLANYILRLSILSNPVLKIIVCTFISIIGFFIIPIKKIPSENLAVIITISTAASVHAVVLIEIYILRLIH